MIFQKMDMETEREGEMGDRSGKTVMDSVPVGSESYIGYQVLSCYRNRCNHTHTHTCTHSLPICHLHCLALTQYYPSHHSSCVILLRDTN